MADNWGKIFWGVLLGTVLWKGMGPNGQQQFIDALTSGGEAAKRKKAEEERQRLARILDEAFKNLKVPELPLAAGPLSKVAAPVETDAGWWGVIVPPAAILILGKRGSGKSALAYRLLELFRYRLTPYVVGAPSNNLLPEWIGTVPTLDDLPPDSIALVDEAYIHYHSRRSMAQESAAMSQQLNLSRQRNQTLIFVSQEARQVDRNIASSASVVVIKELGMLQPEFDRPELRKLANEATEALATVGKDKKKWSYVYSPDADHLGLLENQLASFWKPSFSRMFAAGSGATASRPVEKMTPQEKAARARELSAKGHSYSQIMKELGVSKATVVNYLKGYPYRPR